MRRRLYFLLPDSETAEKIENELLLARIAEAQIHFMAKNEDQLITKKLHVASLLQKSDIVHGWQVGLITGGGTGAVLGGLIMLSPELASFFGMGAIMVCAIVGAFLGTWFSGLIAISAPNTQLKQFESALEEGKILLMVDVPKDQVEHVTQLIESHYQEVQSFGTDAKIPAFP